MEHTGYFYQRFGATIPERVRVYCPLGNLLICYGIHGYHDFNNEDHYSTYHRHPDNHNIQDYHYQDAHHNSYSGCVAADNIHDGIPRAHASGHLRA
ncbi:hypothetical protein CRENBAI_010192 [Crenichthys baileyi]|uniref:Uncharacterized protein n=1 Tax=Crenichthys baileyi TaxID=28760 RepID=A0AAV9R984_9TELE